MKNIVINKSSHKFMEVKVSLYKNVFGKCSLLNYSKTHLWNQLKFKTNYHPDCYLFDWLSRFKFPLFENPIQFKSTLLPYPKIKLEITKSNLKTSPLVIYSVFFIFLMYANKLYASALRVGGTELLIALTKCLIIV